MRIHGNINDVRGETLLVSTNASLLILFTGKFVNLFHF